ncbi:hypothetical protein ACXWYY_003388 [Enterobacter hormaechei]
MSNSDKVVTKDGKKLAGNAATLYIASQNGGMDQYTGGMIDAASQAAGRAAVEAYKRQQRRAKLKSVK